MDELNKGLFTFASYNAGPGRIGELRREAAKRGPGSRTSGSATSSRSRPSGSAARRSPTSATSTSTTSRTNWSWLKPPGATMRKRP